MLKKVLVLLLSLILFIGLPTTQVHACDMGKVGEYQVMSSSRWHTAVIKPDGSLWMWGSNIQGEIGIGTISDTVSIPVKVMDNVVSVSCGEYYTAAIQSDGSLWMWGSNENGQLGNGGVGNAYSAYGEYMIQTTPVKILDGVAAVCCGGSSTMMANTAAILTDGSLWVWGRGLRNSGRSKSGNATPVKVMDDVVAVSCDENMAAAVTTDGSLWVWGLLYNLSGSGYDKTYKYFDTPVKIADGVVSVSCDSSNVSFIKSDLSLWIWGENWSGKYGNGTVDGNVLCAADIPPVPVPGMDHIISVSCARTHVLALKEDGSLWGWGNNYFSQMGNNRAGNYIKDAGSSYEQPLQTIPIKIMDNVSVATGAFGHTMAIKQDGTIWGWGENEAGVLGFSGGNREVTFSGAVGSGDNTEQFQNIKGVQTVPQKMDNFTAW